MIYAADGGAPEKSSSGNTAMIVAIARAWQWQEQLESGEYSTVEELAAANKTDASYVRRMLRLTSLAPNLVEAIMDDQAPPNLSLRQLHREVALSWVEQRSEVAIAD